MFWTNKIYESWKMKQEVIIFYYLIASGRDIRNFLFIFLLFLLSYTPIIQVHHIDCSCKDNTQRINSLMNTCYITLLLKVVGAI